MSEASSKGSGHTSNAPEATLISVILDRSGSMQSVREPTIAGFNKFLHEQQTLGDGGVARMSLTQFDDRYEVNFVGEAIEDIPDLDEHSYVPRGNTALYDAIGRTVHAVEAWTREQDWKERVLVLIITDGQENFSKEYDFPAVRRLIEEKEKAGWNFAYMGANQDSYAVAGSLNIRRDFTANYDASPLGTSANYSRMAMATSAYRSNRAKGADAPSFFAPDGGDENGGKLTPKESTDGRTGPK